MDWIAVAWSCALWAGYHFFSKYWARDHASLLREMNRQRRDWMYKLTFRENRIADVAALANLSSSPTFFASTTIIIIGGLLALLGSMSAAVDVMSKLPFIADAPETVWEIKILALLVIFVFAFFRFTWSLRLFNFSSTIVGAAGLETEFAQKGEAYRSAYADHLGALVALASGAHNDGLRAYYFAIATLTWFVQPAAFMITTSIVVLILFYREFRSEVLQTLLRMPR